MIIIPKPKPKTAKLSGPWVAATRLRYPDGHTIEAGEAVKGDRLEKWMISSGKVVPKPKKGAS